MPTISTLIFDFGDVFINLDKHGAMTNALQLFAIEDFTHDMLKTNEDFETGVASREAFIGFYKNKFKHLEESQILNAWNYIIKDFPQYRLEFLQTLKDQGKYNLILLSNTNALHIEYIKETVPFFEDFKNCFDGFYLSHEIGLRKPTTEIFEFIITENHLNTDQCLFIDDTKENTDTAVQMGFHVWNINKTSEDVVDLFSIKKELF